MEMSMQGRDVWVKHTTAAGNVYVSYHRVWDIGIFMETLQRDARKAGGKAAAEQTLEPKRAARH